MSEKSYKEIEEEKPTKCKKFWQKRLPITQWLPRYTKEDIVADFIAGLTVGLTMIPQSVAYAGLAGLKPQYGTGTTLSLKPIIWGIF